MSTTRSFLTRYAPFLGATLAFALLVGGTQLYASWTAAPASPPNNNVDAPLNVGSDDQVKSGRLTSLSGVRGNGIALGFCPFGSCSYPYETINLVDGQNLRINYDSREEFAFFNDGNFQAGKFTDGDNPSFLVDPHGSSYLNQVSAAAFYDSANPGRYVMNPSWVSKIHRLEIEHDTNVPYPDDANDIASKQYVDDSTESVYIHARSGSMLNRSNWGRVANLTERHDSHNQMNSNNVVQITEPGMYRIEMHGILQTCEDNEWGRIGIFVNGSEREHTEARSASDSSEDNSLSVFTYQNLNVGNTVTFHAQAFGGGCRIDNIDVGMHRL